MNLASASKNPDAKSYLEEIENILHEFLNPEHDEAQLRKREQILQSATNLFVAHGYRKTSMEEVANAAGVAKGTVYLYFQNKAELLFHAIALQDLQYMDEMASALDPVLSPRDQLRRMIVLSITLSSKAPLYARMTSGDHEFELVLKDINNDTLSRVNKIQIDFLSKLIDSATDGKLAPIVVKQRAMVLIDLIFAVTSSVRWIQSEMTLEEYAHLLSDMVVKGIAS